MELGLLSSSYSSDWGFTFCSLQFFSIDIGSLLIGAMYTGQFEERIKHIIREVTASNGQIILFIDEIQTVVGAGIYISGTLEILTSILYRKILHISVVLLHLMPS